MNTDDRGRRTDGQTLTYSEYIGVPALLASLTLPAEPPRGSVAADWPERPPGYAPGDPWPRGGRWSHDESLFITVHQCFELWFRQMHVELRDVMLDAADIAARHGAAVPLVNLEARLDPPRLEDRAAQYPRTWALAEALPPTHPLRATADAPGFFHVDDGARLAWFEGRFSTWAERVTRCAMILRSCLPFYDVLSRMSPVSFLEFRARIFPASGFGSMQFRLLEIALGLRERHFDKLPWGDADPDVSAARAALESAGWAPAERGLSPGEDLRRHYPEGEYRALVRRMGEPTLRDLAYWLLNARDLFDDARRGVDDCAATVFGDMLAAESRQTFIGREAIEGERWRETSALLSHREVIAAEALHHGHEGARAFFEGCLDLDLAVLQWREAHVRFVERMIGARPGTGGGGVQYLRRTLGQGRDPLLDRVFPCLWASRTIVHVHH